jgi:four helix bundle protein
MIRSYEDLEVWQKSMALVELCYRAVEHMPERERLGLAGQIRRTAVSIPSNIAEGHVQTTPAYRRHLRIALGSQAELETQLELAARLGLAQRSELIATRKIADEVGRMLKALPSRPLFPSALNDLE